MIFGRAVVPCAVAAETDEVTIAAELYPSLNHVALLPGAKVPSCCKPSSSNVMLAGSPPTMPKSIYILGFWLKLGEGDVGAVIGGGGGGAEDLMFG